MSNDTFTSALSDKDAAGPLIWKNKEVVKATDADKEDNFSHEFKKQVLFKLNKILYKMERIKNVINKFEENIKFRNNENDKECDIQFPLVSLQDLTNFEEQL